MIANERPTTQKFRWEAFWDSGWASGYFRFSRKSLPRFSHLLGSVKPVGKYSLKLSDILFAIFSRPAQEVTLSLTD